MISRNAMTAIAVTGLALLTGGLVAQQTPESSRTEMQQKMKAQMQEKMKNGGMMGQMMTGDEEMSQLMSLLKESMAALRSEKDPAALQAKLAEHAALLDQLQAKMSAQHSRMQSMMSMMETMMAPESGKASK